MNCCEKCFIPTVLKDIVRSSGKLGDCNFCGQRQVSIYNLNEDKELDVRFNEILSIFRVRADLPSEYPPQKLVMIKDEISSKWNIFKNFTPDTVYTFLHNLLKHNFSEKLVLLDTSVGILEYVNQDYLNANSLLKGYTWDNFIYYIKHRNRFHLNHINYSVLKIYLEGLTSTIFAGEVLFRARISNIDLLTVSNMGSPPEAKAQAGRANSEGIAHLYLASKKETAIREVRPKSSDIIYIGEFPITADLKVINFRKLSKVNIFDLDDPAMFVVNYDYFKRLNDEISKPIKTGDSKLDYLPTQFFVDYIKYINEFEMRENDIRYSGIVFDSTVCPEGHNIMLFNSEEFRCRRIEKYKINNVSYGHQLIDDDV